MSTYIGVDPGKGGGLAAVRGAEFSLTPMPPTDMDIYRWLLDHRGEPVFAVMERVTGYIGDGGNPGARMFAFGQNYGALRMALIAVGVPFETVTPAVWQRAVGVTPRKKTETKTVWKNRLKSRAQELFPRAPITLATADAILLAEYCRRKREGRL